MALQRISIGMAALCLTVLLLTMSPACAYLDPGMGSYMLQIAIAAVIGGAFAIKVFFHRLVNWRKPPAQKPEEEKHD
ncbi:MAG: hypothetical protein ACYDCO_18240 [Armatimonadota bacterium]